MRARPRVLVLSGSDDLLEELSAVLDGVGFEAGSARIQELERSEVDLQALLRGFDPQVVLLDLALPYARSGEFLRQARALPGAQGRAFVLVSANARAAAQLAGLAPQEPVLELLLTPQDLAELVRRVHRAAHAGPGAPHAAAP